MGAGSSNRVVQSAAGVLWDGSVAVSGQTTNSKAYNVNQFNWVGLSVDVGTITGAAAEKSVQAKLQLSADGGTTWGSFSSAEGNTAAQGVLPSAESDQTIFRYWRNAPGFSKNRVRVQLFCPGGADTTVSAANFECRLIAWDRVKGSA